MEGINAKTESGARYLLVVDSEDPESDYLRGEGWRIAPDKKERALGNISLRKDMLEVGQRMNGLISNESTQAPWFSTPIVEITREKYEDEDDNLTDEHVKILDDYPPEDRELAEAFMKFGKHRGYSLNLLKEFVDEALELTKDFTGGSNPEMEGQQNNATSTT